MADKYKPFQSGYSYRMWTIRNCDVCKKFNPTGPSDCAIDMALSRAYFEDGYITLEISERMGYVVEGEENVLSSWPCPEREIKE